MNYISAAVSDKGSVRKNNQDSILVKVSEFDNYGQAAIAVICDGMGGYSKGELASATVISGLDQWFDRRLPQLIPLVKLDEIAAEWIDLLSKINNEIRTYGEKNSIKLGTTFSGILFLGEEFIIVHVGDSRIYCINDDVVQLTEDHSLVAREVKRGNITAEEARLDSRRNVLLQCIGLSKQLKPYIISGKVNENDVFLLCSDGLYHTFNMDDMRVELLDNDMKSVGIMRKTCQKLITMAKENGEKDNLSMALVKCTSGKKVFSDENGLVQNIKLIHSNELI